MTGSTFCFLILHYMNNDDTIKCVESIEHFCLSYHYYIVIVDNGSANGSGLELQKIYAGNDKVVVLLSKENLGFARGNNVGFKYSKEHLNPDFIIMINNDTYMLQKNFCGLISEEFENSSFGVLGPRIIMNGNKISDYSFEPESIQYVTKKLRSLKIRRFLNKMYISGIWKGLSRFKRMLKPSKPIDTSCRKTNVVLQGCALIFSRKYINLFDGIDDRTFLYNEEQLLYWRCVDADLLTVYNPYLFIYHNENAATDKITHSSHAKERFVIENELKSTTILFNDLQRRTSK